VAKPRSDSAPRPSARVGSAHAGYQQRYVGVVRVSMAREVYPLLVIIFVDTDMNGMLFWGAYGVADWTLS
jgi:hypothetical protein